MLAAWSRAWTGLAAGGIFWLVWVANFNDLEFGGADPERPYSFLRHLFGEPPQPALARLWDVDEPVAYQFGLALLWSPFYAIGKLVAAAGLETIGGYPAGVAAIALAISALVAVTCALLVPVLRWLGLGHGGFALFAGVFGTPLFYYGSFASGMSHVPDTLLLTILVFLLARYFRSPLPSRWLPVAMGAVVGYATTVRFFNVFFGVALVIGFASYRRIRPAATIALASAATFGVLATIPFLVGVDSLTSGYAPEGIPGDSDARSKVTATLGFSPQTLISMLVSDRRGLFVWTPIALFGITGFILLVCRRRDVRPFLAITGALGLSVLLPYAFVPSLAQTHLSNWPRFFTPLFPVVVLGVATLVQLRPKVVIPAASLAVVWTLLLVFYGAPGLAYAVEGQGSAFGFPRRVIEGEITPSDYAHAVYHRSRLAKLLLPDPFDHG
jgi:hypothetical protein